VTVAKGIILAEGLNDPEKADLAPFELHSDIYSTTSEKHRKPQSG
jgi:hypothetical protein